MEWISCLFRFFCLVNFRSIVFTRRFIRVRWLIETLFPSVLSLFLFFPQFRSPVLKNVLVSAASYIVGAKFHSRRAVKKQEKSSSRQQQKLYERYVQDVSALQLQNSQLQEYIQQSTVQQLTEEFLTADTNNDRRVSRLEFEKYKKQYLEKHPDADPGMFPRFEDFDPDHNGMVTLKEHEDYYRQQGMVA
jgi:hypothetical protein